MTKNEFERLARIGVTEETYTKVIEPMYLSTELSKEDFIKLLNLNALAAPKKKEKTIKVMLVRDNSGHMMTPNGCYYHINYVELVDVDISSGRFIVKALENEDFEKLRNEGRDLRLGYSYDFDYSQCVDTKKKPIRIAA